MKRVIVASNNVSSNLDSRLDSMLQDFAQITGMIDYNDIIQFGDVATSSDIKNLRIYFKKLNSICRELAMDYYESAQEDSEAAEYVDAITSILKYN